MQLVFRNSFWKDVKHCKDHGIKNTVKQIIFETEQANSLQEIKNLKKPSGFKSAYRIQIGDYRLGLDVQGDKVEFIRLLHRKEIYRYFP